MRAPGGYPAPPPAPPPAAAGRAAPPQQYEPPPPYDPYAQPGYGPGGYSPPQPYDAATQVFDVGGLRAEADPYADGHTMVTGVPAYDDDFARSATARIEFPPSADRGIGPFGPHEAFGPPPEEVEPEPEPDAEHVFSRFRRIRSHAQQPGRKRRGWIGVAVVLVLFAAAAGLKFLPASPWSSSQADEAEPEPVPIPFHQVTITASDVDTEGFLSWAYQDLREPNGLVVGSENQNETTATASMITVWFAADLLRRAAEEGVEPSEDEKADIEQMIRDDDLEAAERVIAKLGSYEESIDRLTAMCRLAATLPAEAWQDTAMTAQDAARLGGCILDVTAAGAEWTPWLLNVMRQVRGAGDFGIREAFPAEQRANIAIKNGVMLDEATGEWRANCLAIGDDWSLAVLQRYPSTGDEAADLAHVDSVCQRVVQKLTQ